MAKTKDGKRLPLYYKSIKKAKKDNPYLYDFEYLPDN